MKRKAMKCFSVHMKLGVIPGIRLAPPHFNHLIIGDLAFEHTVFRINLTRREKQQPVMLNATIQWTSRMSSPQTIEGLPRLVRTRHIIYPHERNFDQKALVMLGAYQNAYRFLYVGEYRNAKGKRNRKLDPVFEIGNGSYPISRVGFVRQKLCTMLPDSYIVLISKDQTQENKYVYWDGTSLHLLTAPPIITLS